MRSEGITQRQRDHVIREEITQALGLMRDLDIEGSIFSQSDASMTDYSATDRDIIRLWEALRPLTGHSDRQIGRILENLRAAGSG